jgi:hypothetical protein
MSPKLLTPHQLVKRCLTWDGSRGAFAQLVADALLTLGMTEEGLAEALWVSSPTVARWARGASCPAPVIRGRVVGWLCLRARELSPSGEGS